MRSGNGADIKVFRPDRPGLRSVLGDLEAEIMELIWRYPGQRGTTVRDVFERLAKGRRIAYTTVMTTMARLARKRLLRTETRGQAHVYYPNFNRDEFASQCVSRILDGLLVSFPSAALRHRSLGAAPQSVRVRATAHRRPGVNETGIVMGRAARCSGGG